MTRTFSRRNLIASAGAGLVLAGCTHPGRDYGLNAGGNHDGRYGNNNDGRGPGEDHGIPPTYDPDAHDSGDTTFKGLYHPKFIALVHAYLRSDWQLDLNYACHPIDETLSEDGRLALAVDIFNAKVPLGGTRKNFGELLTPYSDLYRFKDYGAHEQFDLDDFTFRSQNEIFFLFDNPHIIFNADPLMTFTSRSSSGFACDPNYAFFAARLVDPALTGNLSKVGRIVRVRNYVTNDRGWRIGSAQWPKTHKYSMNIHFKVRNYLKTDEIPMIFDPDTGNGSGYEP